jgi:5-methylcytosine-specific restriction endonuclease McrA
MNKQYIQQLKNREKRIQKAWQMANLSSNEIAKQIYKSSDQFLNSKEWRDLRKLAIQKFGSTCVFCGALQTKTKPVNIDHIKPRKFFPELVLDINNLQPLCSPCNKRKGNKY